MLIPKDLMLMKNWWFWEDLSRERPCRLLKGPRFAQKLLWFIGQKEKLKRLSPNWTMPGMMRRKRFIQPIPGIRKITSLQECCGCLTLLAAVDLGVVLTLWACGRPGSDADTMSCSRPGSDAHSIGRHTRQWFWHYWCICLQVTSRWRLLVTVFSLS